MNSSSSGPNPKPPAPPTGVDPKASGYESKTQTEGASAPGEPRGQPRRAAVNRMHAAAASGKFHTRHSTLDTRQAIHLRAAPAGGKAPAWKEAAPEAPSSEVRSAFQNWFATGRQAARRPGCACPWAAGRAAPQPPRGPVPEPAMLLVHQVARRLRVTTQHVRDFIERRLPARRQRRQKLPQILAHPRRRLPRLPQRTQQPRLGPRALDGDAPPGMLDAMSRTNPWSDGRAFLDFRLHQLQVLRKPS